MSAALDSKAALRVALRAQLAALPPEVRATASGALCERLLALAEWQAARAVLLFYPLADEPDLRPAIEAALGSGKVVALPRSRPAANTYEAACVSDLAQDLAPGRFGVLEPRPECPQMSLNQLDLAVVPGLAFDGCGRRLGRGAGHYDRLLADFAGRRVGVAWEFQIVASLPREPHDVLLDGVMTPTRWLPRATAPLA